MTTEQSLLAQIHEHPTEDAPRLVYAHWLTSRGDPRGELITLQCRLAATPDDEARRKLKTAENRLLKQHAQTWAQELLTVVPAIHTGTVFETEPKFTFHRGFIDELAIGYNELPRLPAILAAVPLLRSLRVDTAPLGHSTAYKRPWLKGLLDVPALARIESLDLRLKGLGDVGVRELAECPHFTGLRSLKLRASARDEQTVERLDGPYASYQLTEKGARTLAGSPYLTRIETLDLAVNGLNGAAVGSLLGTGWPLRSLELGYNGSSALGQAFASATRPPTLRFLGLAGIGLGGENGLLAGASCLSRLESLDLEHCSLGANGFREFLTGFALPHLRHLRLERNQLCDRGTIALAESPMARQLTSLELGHNRIGKKGAAALASSPHLSSLERLLLNESTWKEETIRLFAESPTLANTRIYVKGRPLKRSDEPEVAKGKGRRS